MRPPIWLQACRHRLQDTRESDSLDTVSNGEIVVLHPGKSTRRSPQWQDDAEELFASDVERRPHHGMNAPTDADKEAPGPTVIKVAPTGRKPVRRPRLRRSGLNPARTWGAVGFVGGIIFWHLIGFWSFVVDTIYPLAAQSVASAPATAVRSAANPHTLATRATKARNGKAATAVATNSDAWTAKVLDAPSD